MYVLHSVYLRLKAPGTPLRQKQIFGLRSISFFLLLLFIFLFFHCLLPNSLIVFNINALLIEPLDALLGVKFGCKKQDKSSSCDLQKLQ